jgi:aspartate kinase
VSNGARRRQLLALIDAAAREYRELTIAVGVLGHLEPRTSDVLVSRGERVSAAVVAAAVTEAGRQATFVDAGDVVETDGHHGGAARVNRRKSDLA